MTRKDFELIAATIKNMRGFAFQEAPATREDVAKAFANVLHQTNPRFNWAKFVAACLPKEG